MKVKFKFVIPQYSYNPINRNLGKEYNNIFLTLHCTQVSQDLIKI